MSVRLIYKNSSSLGSRAAMVCTLWEWLYYSEDKEGKRNLEDHERAFFNSTVPFKGLGAGALSASFLDLFPNLCVYFNPLQKDTSCLGIEKKCLELKEVREIHNWKTLLSSLVRWGAGSYPCLELLVLSHTQHWLIAQTSYCS